MNPAAVQELTVGPVGTVCTLLVRREKHAADLKNQYTYHEVKLTRIAPEIVREGSLQNVAAFRYLPEEKKRALRILL